MRAFKPVLLIAGLALAPVLAGCGGSGGGGGGISKADPKVKALLAELPPAYAAADLENGRAKFEQCRQCHTITPDGPNMTGPNLYGVFGKPAGTNHANYTYTEGLKGAGLTWDAASLDKWITDPRSVAPNTKMSFPGLPSAADRRDVIAYLKVASSGGAN
jgi:cytochrome c